MTRTEARRLVAEARSQGGFTYDLRTKAAVQAGYAFSENPEHEEKSVHLDARSLRRYVASHWEALRAPGAHFGAWHDGGVWYLDVTHVEEDQTLALMLAYINDQLAVYDLATRRSLSVY